mgnify:CR=1
MPRHDKNENRCIERPIAMERWIFVSLWHKIIGEPTITDAIMDRIVYNSHRIELDGESVKRKMYGVD